MEKKFEIVSLGVNCLPRTILTRNKIKPTKADGELTGPFDLVIHRLDRIIHYLKNNFEDYFDDIEFVLRKRNFLDFRNQGYWKKSDGTIFRHDKDCKAPDKEKLVNRNKNRINNFNKIIESKTPVVFVFYALKSENLVDELYEILQKLRKGKPFKLVVIDIYSCIKPNNNEIQLLKLSEPIDNYEKYWNSSKYRNRPVVKYAEKCISEFVQYVAESLVN